MGRWKNAGWWYFLSSRARVLICMRLEAIVFILVVLLPAGSFKTNKKAVANEVGLLGGLSYGARERGCIACSCWLDLDIWPKPY